MRVIKASAVVVLTIAQTFMSPCHAQQAEVISRSFNGLRLNSPGIWNLGSDKVYEIFTTDIAGHLGCYSAATLKPVWEHQLVKEALTSPVVGNFMNTGAPVLAYGSASGKVVFAWPGTGEVISTVDTGLSLTVSPSVATMEDGDKFVAISDDGKIIVLDLDPSTIKARQRYTISNALPSSTAFSITGKTSQPAACSDLNNDGIPEVVAVSDSGVVQVISLTDPPQRNVTRLPQQSQVTTLPGMGNLSGTGQMSIITGVDATLKVFHWTPGAQPENAVQLDLNAPAYGSSLGHLLIGPVNGDSIADLISTSEGTIAARYLGNDFSGKPAFLDIATQQLATSASPFSPALAVTLADGSKSVVSIDSEGTAWEWQPTSAQNTITRFGGVPVPTGFTPAGDLTGNGKLSLVVWNEKAASLSVATLPISLSAESAPLLTLGVNYGRNGRWGVDWAAEWKSRQQQAHTALEKAKAAKAITGTGDDSSTGAIATDSIIAGLDPDDPLSVEFRNRGKTTWIPLAAGVLGVVVLVTVIAILLTKKKRHPRA